MFILTGASGKLGRRIVDHLLAYVPAEKIAVSVRDPSKVADLAMLGIRVRLGDYSDPATLRHAWEGGKHLLLVSSNAAATGGDPLKQHAAAIGVAQDLGVERVFYTSQVSCSDVSHFPPGRDHAVTGRTLEAPGLPWTAMRHGFYAESALSMYMRGFNAGVLAPPQDGKVTWTSHDVLTAADAAPLAGVEVIDGPTPPLTGSEALDLADLARIASVIMGRPISRAIITEADMAASARSTGMPEGAVAVMIGYYRAARAKEFATIDTTPARLLGHPPETMQNFMQAKLV